MRVADDGSDVEVRGLEKSFGSTSALRALSFKVAAGSTVGVTGTGNTGKTTLISILAGFLKPSSGRARVLGAKPGAACLRGRVGTFSQRATLPRLETVSEFLQHLARLQGLDPSVHLEEILELLGLTGVLQMRCERVSASTAKRIALAAALIGKPRVLLLDEPTLGLLPDDARLVRVALHELALRSTIIVASEDSSVLDTCDAIVTLPKPLVEGSHASRQRKSSGEVRPGSVISTTAKAQGSRPAAEVTPS